MTTYCSTAAKYSDQQGTLSSDFWSNVDYTAGQGVNGGRYAQRTFSFRSNTFGYMNDGEQTSYGMYYAWDVG